MTSLSQIKPQKLEKVLLANGFIPRKGKGSHVVYKHPDGRRTVVPFHNRPLRIGTLRSILRQTQLSASDLS